MPCSPSHGYVRPSISRQNLEVNLKQVILLISAALLSRTILCGYETDDDKTRFFLFQNTEAAMTTLVIAWSKVTFAITLLRIVRNRYLKYFLWFVIVTANLVLVPGMISILGPCLRRPEKGIPGCIPYVHELHLPPVPRRFNDWYGQLPGLSW